VSELVEHLTKYRKRLLIFSGSWWVYWKNRSKWPVCANLISESKPMNLCCLHWSY
jgi:hypothetical protein